MPRCFRNWLNLFHSNSTIYRKSRLEFIFRSKNVIRSWFSCTRESVLPGKHIHFLLNVHVEPSRLPSQTVVLWCLILGSFLFLTTSCCISFHVKRFVQRSSLLSRFIDLNRLHPTLVNYIIWKIIIISNGMVVVTFETTEKMVLKPWKMGQKFLKRSSTRKF